MSGMQINGLSLLGNNKLKDVLFRQHNRGKKDGYGNPVSFLHSDWFEVLWPGGDLCIHCISLPVHPTITNRVDFIKRCEWCTKTF